MVVSLNSRLDSHEEEGKIHVGVSITLSRSEVSLSNTVPGIEVRVSST